MPFPPTKTTSSSGRSIPKTQFVFQADFAAIAKDIDASDVMDVSVGGLSNDTMDDPSLYLLRQRKDVRVRWFDSGSDISSGGATLVPFQLAEETSIYFPSFVPIPGMMNSDSVLFPEVSSAEYFKHYHSKWIAWPSHPFVTARYFDDTGILITSGEVMSDAVTAGENFSFNTWWVANNPVADPRRIFIHIYDLKTQQVIAQHDGLDSPPRFGMTMTQFFKPINYLFLLIRRQVTMKCVLACTIQ